MKIQLKEVPIGEVVKGYTNSEDTGVLAYDGKLNVRPAYQREFVYKDKQRDAVIDTVSKGFPLNVLYWVDNGDGTFECLDGQQRIISICQFVMNKFSMRFPNNPDMDMIFESLTDEEKKAILEYPLMVYFCEGTNREKLDWFKTINIAGEKLTDQELRNAIYTGPWLADAKKYFSKTGGPAYQCFGDFLKGTAIRQEYLETVIGWIADRDGVESVSEYMSLHQHDADAADLWDYFEQVRQWVERKFKNRDKARTKLMCGQPWGIWYNKYEQSLGNANEVENEIARLIADEEVQNKRGIYEYLFDGNEKHLSLRTFDERDKQRKYAEQGGICPKCGPDKHYEYDEMQADHIEPWSKGGKTEYSNLQMLCRRHNAEKSDS